MTTITRPHYYYKSFAKSDRISGLMQSLDPSQCAYSGRLSPSGRLSIGYVPQHRRRVEDVRYEANRGHWAYSLKCHWHYLEGVVAEVEARETKAETLGLSIAPNCRNDSAKRYGLRGMTSNGRNRVYDGAYLLHRAFRGRLGFYTLTCPYTDAKSIYLFNQNINYIVRSYFEELKRAYSRVGVHWSYVSVLEYQDKRYEADGVPVLHLHYVAACYYPGTTKFILSADEIRSTWGRVLRRVVASEALLRASVDAVVVKTSAAHYLAKYLSKGGRTVAYLANTCPDQVPRQWWSMSRDVRECIKRHTVILGGEICQDIIAGCRQSVDRCLHFVYSQHVYASISGQDRLVGFFGQLTPKDRDLWITYDLDILRKFTGRLTSSD